MKIDRESLISQIDEKISAYLPQEPSPQWINSLCDFDLSQLSSNLMNQIQEPAKKLLLNGGKRWRPLLLIYSALLANNKNLPTDEILSLAIMASPVVELAHNGTLLIDDIEDKSDKRRGEPCAHITFGEDLAINCGNWLYFLPTQIFEQLPISATKKANLYKIFCSAMRAVHLGQGMDICWHKSDNFFPTKEHYLTMCKLKTGALATMAVEIGVELANGSEVQKNALVTASQNFGVSFQILDDIKNLTTGNVGKNRGDDLIEGKKSLPLILLSEKIDMSTILPILTWIKTNGLKNSETAIDQIVKKLETHNALSDAKNIASNLIEESKNLIKQNFEDSEALTQLLSLIEGFLK